MIYEVTLRTLGGMETVLVEAETGDEAAMKAQGGKAGVVVAGVNPASIAPEPAPKRGRPALQGENA